MSWPIALSGYLPWNQMKKEKKIQLHTTIIAKGDIQIRWNTSGILAKTHKNTGGMYQHSSHPITFPTVFVTCPYPQKTVFPIVFPSVKYKLNANQSM